MSRLRSGRRIMAGWLPGSGDWLWWREALDLWTRQPLVMARWCWTLWRHGHPEHLDPVLLGNDGRVWDGHHRVVAARIVRRKVPSVIAARSSGQHTP